MTVTRRIRRRGERSISRKTIAQGRRNAPTVPVCSCAHSLVHIARETAGAASTRRSLRPLFFGRNDLQSPGETRRGNAEVGLCIVIASGAKQSISPRKERMDCFAALAMTWTRRWQHPQLSSPANGSANGRPMTGSGGRSSIPETAAIEPRSRGVLDPPHARGMTALVSLRGASATKQSMLSFARRDGLFRGACHRARIRATRDEAYGTCCGQFLAAIIEVNGPWQGDTGRRHGVSHPCSHHRRELWLGVWRT